MRGCSLCFCFCLAPVLCNAAELISKASAISQTAAGASYAPAISPDGRFIAFSSHANNLVTNDRGRWLDLFVHDMETRQTRLVFASQGNTAYPSFSANGRWLVFASDVAGVSHIFLYDQQTGSNAQLTAGSLASPHGPPPNGSSRPVLTPDARWVLFESSATNLVDEPDANGVPDLFVRDVQAQSNILISVGAQSWPPRPQFAASITSDGGRVAFVSRNIPGPTKNTAGRAEVFVRDVAQSRYHWASTNVGAIIGSATNEYACFDPRLSTNGSVVAFKVAPIPASTNGLVLRHDLETGQTALIASNSLSEMSLGLSSDGRYVAYDSLGQIFRYDAQSGSNQLVTVNRGGTAPANGDSQGPVLTPDGQKIAFLSTASDLTAAGNPGSNYQIYVRDLNSGHTRLVSAAANSQPAGSSLAAALLAISDDGMRVAFDYSGSDLASNDLNEASDIFVFHAGEDRVRLISGALSEQPAVAALRGIAGETNSISADGTKVTFGADAGGKHEIFAANLANRTIQQVSTGDSLAAAGMRGVLSANGDFCLYFRRTGDFIGAYRLFRRNLVQGLSEEVDPAVGYSTSIFQARSFYPAISDDGNLVAYARNPTQRYLFIKDMTSGSIQYVTNRMGSSGTTSEPINPRFTPDSRWLLFEHSVSGELTTNVWSDGQYALFARDLVGYSNIMISMDASGGSLGRASSKSISASGRYVAYDVWRQAAVPERFSAYVFDLIARENGFVCTNCWDPSLSAEGRFVAYVGRPSGISIDYIYVKDRASGTVARIGNGAANDSSSRPLLSVDGRYVVFTSKASNLVADDNNGAQDVFLHDRYRGATYRLSAGSAPSTRHIISRDGRTVVFQSLAGEMSPGDYNEALDLFFVRLGAGDADQDGMDDAWEVTYFDNTNRNGSGDYDGDGHSDFQEFLAGTDPTNSGSVLEVIAIQSLNSAYVRILWSAAAGKSYVIQFQPALETSSWINTGEAIAADGPVASIELAQAFGNGFYRVVLVQ